MAIKHSGKECPALDELIEEITLDAYGDDEQLWAFRQAFEDHVPLPAEAFVIGETVTVLAIDYEGNPRRGLAAKCRREEGSEQVIAACDLIFPEKSTAARYMAAYRKWLGMEPNPRVSLSKAQGRPRKAAVDDLDMSRDVELIVLAVKENAVSCRIPGKGSIITLRTGGLWEIVPSETITVASRKQWRYGGHLR